MKAPQADAGSRSSLVSRRVLGLHNNMDTVFCVDCLEQALQAYGVQEIFNTDQGGAVKLHVKGIPLKLDAFLS